MKKLGLALGIIGIVLLSFAVQSGAQSSLLNYRGPIDTHRSDITGDAGAVPTVPTNAFYGEVSGSPIGYSHIDVFVDITGGTWRVSPLIWNPTANLFFEASGQASSSIAVDHQFTVIVDHADYVYMQCDKTRGDGTATIYLQGVNRW
jgi:hypothetical protein